MNETSDGVIHEILARCLVEPAFLERLQADPDVALADYPLGIRSRCEFKNTDLSRIQRFSGFIGKVQHNYLWDSFPATLLLLRHYGIELEVFAKYRTIQLSPEMRNRNQFEKIRRFLAFLDQFLVDHMQYPGLNCVLIQERARWEVLQAVDKVKAIEGLSPETLRTLEWARFLRLRPVLNGPLRIDAFDCDPSDLTASVVNGSFTGHCGGESRFFASWVDPRKRLLHTLQIDNLSALVLSCIDGTKRLSAVIASARQRGLTAAMPRTFRAFFESAASADLIQLLERAV